MLDVQECLEKNANVKRIKMNFNILHQYLLNILSWNKERLNILSVKIINVNKSHN